MKQVASLVGSEHRIPDKSRLRLGHHYLLFNPFLVHNSGVQLLQSLEFGSMLFFVSSSFATASYLRPTAL